MPGKSRTLKLSFQEKPQKDQTITAYAFDRRGNLVSRMNVTDAIDLDKLGGEKVVLGPTLPEDAKVTTDSLRRMRALEITSAGSLDNVTISPDLLDHWRLCACHITGRVVRPVQSGDVTIDYPVCNARVHICEVDRWPWIIYKLSDAAILSMRNDLLGIQPKIDVRIPPLVRKPIPIPDPGPIEEHPGHGEMTMHTTLAESGGALTVSKDAAAMLRSTAETMPSALKAGIASDSLQVVRQTLASSFEYIYPLLCYWPWFWYDCEEIGVVETDHEGRFTKFYLYPCGDQPDLYVWVEYFIGGTWQTVYHPPIRCNTHWNYACGTDITIRITDERVPYCDPRPPLPGKQLVVLTIGNNVNVARIQRQSAGTNRGLTENGEPFGGRIEPHVDFGTGLAGHFYRWSYRRLGSSDTPVIIDAPVFRRYRVELPTGIEYRSFPLGPQTHAGGLMFKVPPLDPPAVAGSLAPTQWVVLNGRDDTASAFFRSDQLGDPLTTAGLYEFFLELFDGAGNPIPDWAAAAIQGRIPSDGIAAPFPPVTITTQPVTGVLAMAEFDVGPTGAPRSAMRFVLHVDNNHCTASIDTLTGSGLVSDTACGFYVYAPNAMVNIQFTATHPNNFATFDFDVYRGASNPVTGASASGRVGTSTVDGFTLSGGEYQKNNVPVTTLLVDCPKAAFAETLYVTAMATDGWSRLSGLDAAGVPKAFALSTS